MRQRCYAPADRAARATVNLLSPEAAYEECPSRNFQDVSEACKATGCGIPRWTTCLPLHSTSHDATRAYPKTTPRPPSGVSMRQKSARSSCAFAGLYASAMALAVIQMKWRRLSGMTLLVRLLRSERAKCWLCSGWARATAIGLRGRLRL